jgi:RNA polymerase sigma-70 factor (ECF subfamily)
MSDVLPSVELAAERVAGIRGRAGVIRFAPGQAAEDGQLVRAARAGDRQAFERLYERYARMVHGLLLARFGRADVEDLVQDVFLAAWRRLDDLRDPAAFGGWLAAITRRRAADHLRRPTMAELPEQVAAAEGTSALTDAALVLRTIASLPDAYRETLVLRLVEGLTGPEIAQRTGLTAASVRVNLHRGMKLLREKLNV